MSGIALIAWSLFCAAASASLTYFIMRSHNEARLAGLKNTEEGVRRKAMDEFLADIRVEERHYTREHKILFLTRKILVRQERIFFRNIPLSNWVEQEMPLEEGVDTDKLARTMSVFGAGPEPEVRKLLRE